MSADGQDPALEALLASLRGRERYHLLGLLGEGSVGLVERVFDAHLGRVVARKALQAGKRDDVNALRAFVNEARILGSLDHGGVIPVFDAYFTADGRPAYTMREIEGRSLAKLLELDRRTGHVVPLPLHRTLRIFSQLAEALTHAHERGVIHLDLKPQNIVVLDHDEVVVVDWGTATRYAPERATQKLAGFPELVAWAQLLPEDAGLIVGTPRYMAPEQTERPRTELGPAADIFSLGILFYQMLTGRLPFEASSLEELLFHIRETQPHPPHALDGSIHRRLSAIVMRMLAKAPAERYVDLSAFLRDLDAFRSSGAEFPERHFEAGEVIFAEEDTGEFACVIVEGEVEIWTGQGDQRRVLGRHLAGDVFGELALLRDMPRSASATARLPTRVRMIDRDSLTKEVERLSPWVLAMLGGVVERFVDRSERLVELLRDGRGASGR